jgi:uncharacterized membrane protein
MEWLILLGIVTGMRTMTAMAVLCWAAWLQLLPQTGWAAWTGYLVSVIVFTVFALGEYIGDTLPTTPSRVAAGPLTARLVFGSLVGAIAAHAMGQPVAGGVIFGLVGALIGAYGGHRLRALLAGLLGHDLPVALAESSLALGLALWAVWTLHLQHLLIQASI